MKAPAHLLEKPYLRPVYDEPEFVVRNLWRLYGGWYDGNPAHLKPPTDAALAAEMAALAGGATRLAERAAELADAGDLRLAGHLAELAAQAAPDDAGVHQVRAEVFGRRAQEERSTMSKGVFSWAQQESRDRPTVERYSEVGLIAAERVAAALGLLPVLLAAQGREVEEVVRAAGGLEAPRVLRVRVEDPAVDLEEAPAAGHVVGLLGVEHAILAQAAYSSSVGS